MNRLLRCALPLAAAFLVSANAGAAGTPAAAQPGYRVINLMPAYWDFHAKTSGLAPEAQAVNDGANGSAAETAEVTTEAVDETDDSKNAAG